MRRDLTRFRDAMVGLSLALRGSRPIRPGTDEGRMELNQWDSDLHGFTDDELFPAIEEARRTCEFMPKPKQLIALCLQERAKMQRAFGPPPARDTDHCPQCGSTYRSGRVWRNGTVAHRAYCDHDWARVVEVYNLPDELPLAEQEVSA